LCCRYSQPEINQRFQSLTASSLSQLSNNLQESQRFSQNLQAKLAKLKAEIALATHDVEEWMKESEGALWEGGASSATSEDAGSSWVSTDANVDGTQTTYGANREKGGKKKVGTSLGGVGGSEGFGLEQQKRLVEIILAAVKMEMKEGMEFGDGNGVADDGDAGDAGNVEGERQVVKEEEVAKEEEEEEEKKKEKKNKVHVSAETVAKGLYASSETILQETTTTTTTTTATTAKENVH
jgi:hypothetical protein